MPPCIKIDKMTVENFRSIRYAEVEFGALTFLVGPNGSGKSNLLDAIGFVGQSLFSSLEYAIHLRSGILSILHAPFTLPSVMRFTFELSATDGFSGFYSVAIEAGQAQSLRVVREECRVRDSAGAESNFLVEDGKVSGTAAVFPAVSVDRLYLVNASGLPEFRAIYDFFCEIRFSEPAPRGLVFAELNNANPAGSLVARVRKLKAEHPRWAEAVQEYLRAIAPPFSGFEIQEAEGRSWLQFVEKRSGGEAQKFHVSQVSAGTLQAADLLLFLSEPPTPGRSTLPVLIEEPEALLHPGAIRVLRDSFYEANADRQIIVTSHSPEILDDASVSAEWIRSVYRDELGTHVHALDDATQSIVRDQLFTAGELMRQGGLGMKPELAPLAGAPER